MDYYRPGMLPSDQNYDYGHYVLLGSSRLVCTQPVPRLDILPHAILLRDMPCIRQSMDRDLHATFYTFGPDWYIDKAAIASQTIACRLLGPCRPRHA